MTKNEILSYPEVKSLDSQCKKLVVLLHGLGSDGNDLIGLAPLMSREFSDCHFIAPHGVEKFDSAPYGRQWFSLNNRNPDYVRELVAKNTGLVTDIIQKKQAELNLTNKDTILIGFSQGTMMGLYLNFIQKEPFDSMVGFSGRLIAPQECINKTTPVCVIHGELDDVVDVSSMDETVEYLEKYDIPYSKYKIPNLTHSIDDRGIQFAIKFIKIGYYID